MGIRSSVSASAESVTDDNVITVGKINTRDKRGTVDPTKNPYEGSIADRMGIDQEHARVTLMAIAHASPKGLEVPAELPVRDLMSFVRMPLNQEWGVETRYRQRVRSPLTGVRGFCVVTCQSGSAKAVAECSDLSCPLWALRMGRNAHYGKRTR